MGHKAPAQNAERRWQQVRPLRAEGVRWEERDGTVVITVRRTDWVGRLWGWLSSRPPLRRIELDEIGSLVWALCDGHHTVGDIADALVARYQLLRREALASLTEFLTQLRRRGLVHWEEAPPP